MSSLRIAEITPDNVIAACRLTVRPEQEGYVAPVAISLAEAYANQHTAWPRLVYDGERRATVLWKPGEHSPEGFYLRLGFRKTGQQFHDQLVGERSLD